MGEEEKGPKGCLNCNPEEIEPLLEERRIKVEAIPTPTHHSKDVIVCRKCGQAWLLLPRKTDPEKAEA